MKKLILVVIMVIALSACKPTYVSDGIAFNGQTYDFVETDDNGYDIFEYDGHQIEVTKTSNGFIMSTVINEDIFIISGNTESYEISKNGSTVLIDGVDKIATGTESIVWNDDIIGIMDNYNK